MISRRGFVASAAFAAMEGAALAQTPARAEGVLSRPRLVLPPGACDTHVHILDPARFPYSAKRRYTPATANVEQLAALHARLGIERVVVVQNSVYGADNRAITDAVQQLGLLRARGVATLDQDTSSADIAALDRAGIRGARLNLEVGRERNPSAATLQVEDAAQRIPKHWAVHVNAALALMVDLKDTILKLDRTVVLDHFAHATVRAGTDQPGFSEVLDLLKAGKAVVKLSGPYQISTSAGYGDITPLARAYVEAASDRVIWGSDWPHTGGAGRPANQPVDVIEPFRPEDDAFNLDLLMDWVPHEATRRMILVDTPARLYGFA